MSFDFTVSIPEGCLPCCNSPCGKLHAEAGGVFNGFRPFLTGLISDGGDYCYKGTEAASYLYLTAQHKWSRKSKMPLNGVVVIQESHWTYDVIYSGSGDGKKVYECYTYEGYHPDGSTAEWWDEVAGLRKIEHKTVTNNGEPTGYYVDGDYDDSGNVVMPSPNVDGDYESIYCEVHDPTVAEDSRSYSNRVDFPEGYYDQYSASTQLSNKLTFSDAEDVVKAMLGSVDMDGTYVGLGSDGLYYRLTLDDDYPNTHAGTASDPIRLKSVRIEHYPSGNLIRVDQYNYFYGDAHFISYRTDSCQDETDSTGVMLGTLIVEMGKTKAQNGRVFTETYDRGPGYCASEPSVPVCAEVPLGSAASALIEADRGERIEVTVLCGGGGDNWCSQKWGLPP